MNDDITETDETTAEPDKHTLPQGFGKGGVETE